MADEKIKSGDIVELRSGGPLMTVSGFTSNQAICVWFDNNNEFKTAQVFPSALKIVNGKEDEAKLL